MRTTLIFLFLGLITSCNLFRHAPFKYKNEQDSLVYTVVNIFIKEHGIKKTPKTPTTYYFTNYGGGDSSANYFISRMKQKLGKDPILKPVDYIAFKKQILAPSIFKWDRKYLKACRIVREATWLNMANSVSVPLFSADKKKAVIFAHYWGMSRIYIYQYNAAKKTWEYYTTVWQDGS